MTRQDRICVMTSAQNPGVDALATAFARDAARDRDLAAK